MLSALETRFGFRGGRLNLEKGYSRMIELTSLNGSSFVLNSNLIETIETIPETKVTLTNGKYFLVGEQKEEIVQKIITYNRQIFIDTVKLTD